ncbi:nuclear transport factor 2 family protein [Streptomyces sp. AS58]|uniref:nuclear transport factor 2 family protein n=1 Tax=Streptomyces sp. AS58 TaxID=1519489 RepID=UPI000AD29B28|nr:nuclear transport factor 2 family protein [Streptomyces sp. AS58]
MVDVGLRDPKPRSLWRRAVPLGSTALLVMLLSGTALGFPSESKTAGVGVVPAAAGAPSAPSPSPDTEGAAQTPEEQRNSAAVREAFQRWEGGGSFYDILTDDAVWTITGSSPIAGTYTSRQQFLDEAIEPLSERLSVFVKPTVRGLWVDGDTVFAQWDGHGVAKDGQPYDNTYSWILHMKDGRVTSAVAFFESSVVTDLWERVPGSN